MLESKKIKKYLPKIIAHILFWVVIYFFYNYFLGFGSKETKYVGLFSAFLMPITMLISYFVIYYLVPKYLLKKKYKSFILYTIYTLIVSVHTIILTVLSALVFLSDLKAENTSPLTKTLPFIILGVFFVVLIVVSLSLIIHNYRSIVRNEDLKNKILQTQLQLKEQELRLLKMQIHPHFLFNSLNTIYGYALQKKDQAPEMILKLSNLLDYILYQIEKPAVLLSNELNHIEDYIALEKIRFHDTLKVEFHQKNISDGVMISPMLLIPFVENSFKHGAIVEGVLNVTIDVEVKENNLFFKITNSIRKNEDSKTGIGLENIKKRLEMMYQNKYELKIQIENNQFVVELIIDLKS